MTNVKINKENSIQFNQIETGSYFIMDGQLYYKMTESMKNEIHYAYNTINLSTGRFAMLQPYFKVEEISDMEVTVNAT